MASAEAEDEGEVEVGSLKPREEGLAARRPFSTASEALKARTLMLFIMSSIRA